MRSPSSGIGSLPTSTQHMKVANKATALRELQYSHMLHKQKLRDMKPGIDMKPPKAYPHVQVNRKRQQMEAERNSAIERENKILLGKMYTIMNAEPAYKTESKASVTSLNMTVRKQEYDRIARENQAIMQRILQREPHFNRAALDAEWTVSTAHADRCRPRSTTAQPPCIIRRLRRRLRANAAARHGIHSRAPCLLLQVTCRYLKNISEYPFILGEKHIGRPTPARRTLKPLESPPSGCAAAAAGRPLARCPALHARQTL